MSLSAHYHNSYETVTVLTNLFWQCTSVGRQKYAILAMHEPQMRGYLRSKKPTIMNPIAQSVTHTPHSFCSHPEVAEWEAQKDSFHSESVPH